MNAESKTTKVGLAFYPLDVDALADRARILRKSRVKARNGTILRALIYHTSREAMVAQLMQLVTAYALKKGPREAELVVGHPTIELPPDQLDKLDSVISGLARQGVTTTRVMLVRALLRAAPANDGIVGIVQKFLKECPPQPSGWAARKANQSHG